MKKKTKVRDEWIPQTWRYNGSGYQKNKKKEIPRNKKYKENFFFFEKVLDKCARMWYN